MGSNDDDDFESPLKQRDAVKSNLKTINNTRALIGLLKSPSKKRKHANMEGNVVEHVCSPRVTRSSSSPLNVTPLSTKMPPSKRQTPPNMASLESTCSPRVTRSSVRPSRLSQSPKKLTRNSASPVTVSQSPKKLQKTKLSPLKQKKTKVNKLRLKVRVGGERNASPSKSTKENHKVELADDAPHNLAPMVGSDEKETHDGDSMTEQEKGALNPERSEVLKGTSNSHCNKSFRSSLLTMVELFKELNDHNALRKEHEDKMSITPFGSLYLLFKDGKLSIDDVRKPKNAIMNILKGYSRKDDAFNVAGKLVKFKVEDVAVIFGLPVDGKTPKLCARTARENLKSDFVDRYWPGCTQVTTSQITTSVRRVVHKTEDRDLEDFCKMIIMLMVLSIFTPGNSSGIRLSCISLINDFDGLGKIGWATIIYDMLVAQVKKWKADKPFTITSCSVVLLYFLLEHSDIIEPKSDYDQKYPRAAKWSFLLLRSKDMSEIGSLQNVEVTNALTLTDREKKLIGNSSTKECGSGQGRKNDSEVDISNSEKADLLKRVVQLEEQEKLAKDENFILVAEIAQMQIKLKAIEDENIRLVAENTTLIGKVCLLNEVQDENGRIKVENNKLKENLSSYEIKEEIIHEVETENKDEVNTEEKNTPQVRSGIRELKTKKRKKVCHPDFEYPDVAKKRKKEAQDTDDEDVVLLDTDGNPAPKSDCQPYKEPVKLPDACKSPYLQLLKKKEQLLIANFFNRNTESYVAWEDSESALVIFGKDLKAILFDEFISERVIDWFTQYLVNSTETRSASDQYKAEIFPACLFIFLLDKKEVCLKKQLDERVLGLNFGDTEALMFPMIHMKNAKDKRGYHWTLLVLDTTDWCWSHYDSFRPRQRRSKCLEDAKILKSRVALTLKRHKGLTDEEKEKVDGEVLSQTCPQQGGTVNCAIYVCHFMRNLFVELKPPTQTDEEGVEIVKKLKAQICYNILKAKDGTKAQKK